MSAGPRLTWRGEGINYFAHTLIGWNRLNDPLVAPTTESERFSEAGSIFLSAVASAFALFEADYQWVPENFSNVVPPSQPDLRRPNWGGVRLRSGILFNVGGAPEVPPTASLLVQPSEVMVGEPVTATATGSNFNPKHDLTYSWSSSGGKVTGKDNTANIDTNGLAGGSYTVTAHIADPKMKKRWRGELHSKFHRERAAKESTYHVMLGESGFGPGGHVVHTDLHLHQSRRRASDGQRLDRQRGQCLGQRRNRHPEHDRRFRGPDHGERDLYRLPWFDDFGFEPGQRGGSASASAAGQQAEPMRLP